MQLLIFIVSKGGNLLLSIGPDKTGDLVPQVYERLKGIGEWMKINGHAIYGTLPNRIYESGKWRFTKSKTSSTVYAFYLPGENETTIAKQMVLPQLQPSAKSHISLMGYKKSLKWKLEKDGVNITIPGEVAKTLKDTPALTFRIETVK